MNASYSALDTFRSCPLKYKFQEIDKLKAPKNANTVFGTLMHATLKYAHEGGFLLPTQKEALNYFSTNWNADIWKNDTEERIAFASGVKIIQDYYKKNDPSQVKIVDLESRFTIELKEETETHLVSGIIDRIDKTDSGYEIIDYKTNKKLPPQQMVDDNLQLFIYLLAFLKRYPDQESNLEKIKLSLYFLKHGVKLSTTVTPEKLEQGKQKLLSIIQEIKKSTFPPLVTSLCDWCGFQPNCPMWKHKFKEKTVYDEENKQAIIDQYLELSDKLKTERKKVMELQQQIVDIMQQEETERLFSGGKIVTKTLRKTYRYDEEKLRKILEERGMWENVVKVDSSRLKKVMETLPFSVKEKIEGSREIDKESWSITIKKDKPIELQEEDF